jgi:hypothetical protein
LISIVLVDILYRMPFFKFNKGKSTPDLKLSDYNEIWSKFCFLDETGNLTNDLDPYFTIGILKMSQPYYLQSKILYERSKRRFYDEMKFNKLSAKNIEFAKFALDALLDTKSIGVYSYTTNKRSKYYKDNFDTNQWTAYEKITLKLLDAALAEKEIIILIADHITTPKDIKFEVNTKKNFNNSKKRLAIAGVCRFDSKANDLLQLIDLIIGAINYDLKLSSGLVLGSKYKIELVNHIKQSLGINTFSQGFRNRNFSIFVEQGQDN